MAKYKKELKLLDRILKLLSKNIHQSLDFDSIVEKLNLSEIKGEIFGTSVILIPIDGKYNIHFNLVLLRL